MVIPEHPDVGAAASDPELHHRSRLLTAALAVLTAAFVLVDLCFLLTVPGYSPPWYGYLFLAVIFATHRKGRIRLAGALLTFMFPMVSFAHLLGESNANVLVTLGFLSLSPILGSILLKPWGLMLLTGVNLAGIALLPLVVPERGVTHVVLIGPLAMNGISAALAFTLVRFRDRVEADRQANLRNEEERLRLATEAAGIGTWDWRVARDEAFVSPGVRRLFGNPSMKEPRDYFDSITPAERSSVEAAYAQAIEGAQDVVKLEHRIVRLDGRERWIQVDGRVVEREGGRATRIIGTVRDVTELRELEAQLRQAQKMEALGRLAGGIAHDFNNLLTVIRANVEMLNEIAGAPELSDVAQAADSAASLTRQLLAFSRVGASRARVVDVAQSVRGALEMVRRLIGDDVTVRFEADEQPLQTRADPDQIQQALLNLVTNARDAMPGGGEILIEIRRIDLSACRASILGVGPGPYVRVSVCDSGEGMPEAVRERALEPFFTTKGPHKGTGLGLAMVFGVVERAGGAIEIESAQGRGTAVRLFYPWLEGTK